jgi:hypothetical protein
MSEERRKIGFAFKNRFSQKIKYSLIEISSVIIAFWLGPIFY